MDESEQQYLESCTHINQNDLDGEYRRLPADLAYWNARYAEAYERAARAKIDYEQERARAWLEVKETGAKLTVDDVKSYVERDDEVHATHLQYVEADADRLQKKTIVDAIHAKKDMLQSLGAKLRLEMASDPAVRDQLAQQTAAGMQWGR